MNHYLKLKTTVPLYSKLVFSKLIRDAFSIKGAFKQKDKSMFIFYNVGDQAACQKQNAFTKKITLSMFLLFMLLAWRSNAQYISYVEDFNITDLKPYNGSPLAIGSEEGIPEGLTFNTDGSKMYIVGQSGDEVNQYSLSTPFNTNSGVTHDGFYSVAAQYGSNPRVYGITFNNDGSRMFIVGSTGPELTQYTLTTPFDITSGVTYDASYDFLGAGFNSQTIIVFNDTGNKMYVKEGFGITQFSLSVAFDITSTIAEEGTYTLSFAPEEMVFTANGEKMLLIEKTNDLIHQYSLTSPYSIISGVSDDEVSFDVSNEDAFPSGLAISNDNSSIFIVGYASGAQRVRQYDMSISGFTESAANDGSLDGSVTILIDGDTFTNQGGTLTFGSDYTISNLPDGLTPSISVSSGGQSTTLTLSGNVIANQSENSVSALTIAFTNSAFTSNDASSVYNSDGNIATPGIDFYDNIRLTYGNAFDLSKGINLEEEASINTGSTDPIDIAYSTDGSRMFILDASGEIFQYDLSNSFDPSSATLAGSLDVDATEFIVPSSILFNSDGTSIYFTLLSGFGAHKLYHYSVATPFDITSGISSQGIVNVVGMDSGHKGMVFNNDGTRVFVVSSNNQVVRQYNLTIPYDFSTGVTNSTYTVNVSGQDLSPQGVLFNSGGSKMFVLGGVSDAIYQYELSTPFDLSSTVEYNGVSSDLEIAGGSPMGRGMVFDIDGSEISVVIQNGFPNRVNTYSIARGSFDELINDGSISGESVINIFGDTFVNAGSSLLQNTHYTIDNLPAGLTPQLVVSLGGSSAELSFSGNATSNQNINDVASLIFSFADAAFSNSTVAEVQNASAFSSGLGINFRDNNPALTYGSYFDPSETLYRGENFDYTAQDMSPNAFDFNDDGTRLFILGGDNDAVFQYDLSTAFDLSTAVYSGSSFDVSNEEGNPFGMAFSRDGSKMYIVGNTDAIYQYSLLNPFDISSGVTPDGNPLDVTGQDIIPVNLTFSVDGSKLYMLGASADEVNQYSLVTPFDITSGVTFDGTPFGFTQENNPSGIMISNDGFKLFISGNQGDDVNEYMLNVPFDLTQGATYVGNFSFRNEDDLIGDIAFSRDGTQLFVAGSRNNRIYKYEQNDLDFYKSPTNATMLLGSATIYLIDETFTNAGATLSVSDYSISNLPNGLTPILTVSDDGFSATLTLSGSTTSNANVDGLIFTFENTAFTGNDASIFNNVTSFNSGFTVDFQDITWDGFSWNNGTGPIPTSSAIINGDYTIENETTFEATDLTVNSPAVLTIEGSGNMELSGLLLNNSNILMEPFSFVEIGTDLFNFGSIIAQSGSTLITYEGNDFSGNVEIQRNTRYADGKYSFVSTPVEQNSSVTGSDLGAHVYKYDEAASSDPDALSRWVDASSEELVPGRGYTQANKQLLVFEGTPNSGTINYTASATNDGYHMVGNPYPAAIDVDAFIDANATTTETIYIWDDNGSDTGRGANSDYIVATKSGATDNGDPDVSRWNGHIGSMQGFFIQMEGSAGTVTFTEDMRVSGNNADANFYRTSDNSKPLARINLTNEEGLFKQAVIAWNESVSDTELAKGYDGKVFSTTGTDMLYTMKGDHALAIQTVTRNKEVIPLTYQVEKAGVYTIQVNLKEAQDYILYLRDKQTEEVIDLSTEGYSFNTSAGQFTHRFELVTNSRVLGLDEYEIQVYAHEQTIHISMPEGEERIFQLLSLGGQQLLTQKLDGSAQIQTNLPSGVYIVTDGEQSHKIILK